MDQETLLKMDVLYRNLHLRELFISQVIGSHEGSTGFISEEDFWKANEQSLIDELGQSAF